MAFAQYNQPEGSKTYVVGGVVERESSLLTVADVIASRSEPEWVGSSHPQAGGSSEPSSDDGETS